MSLKVFAIVAILVALFVGGVLAMHGEGHKMLARWMPALHGGG